VVLVCIYRFSHMNMFGGESIRTLQSSELSLLCTSVFTLREIFFFYFSRSIQDWFAVRPCPLWSNLSHFVNFRAFRLPVADRWQKITTNTLKKRNRKAIQSLTQRRREISVMWELLCSVGLILSHLCLSVFICG
jgi:hypothetical protein